MHARQFGDRLDVRPGSHGIDHLMFHHWMKDRSKEPGRDEAQFPWFWKNSQFTGERVNDVHLTGTEKCAARERAEGEP